MSNREVYPYLMLALLALAITGCADGDSPRTANAASAVLKLKVDRHGKLFADGKGVTLDELQKKLATLKQKGGVVWYHREAGHTDAPPEAMQAIQAITAAKIPVRLSKEPDFSDCLESP